MAALKALTATAQAASAANSCSSAALDSNYQLCQAEVDANPDVCGTNCQAAVQVSDVQYIFFFNFQFTSVCRHLTFFPSFLQYVSTNCLTSLNDATVNIDPQNCTFTYTQGNSQTSNTTSAASIASATVVTVMATAAAAFVFL